MTSRHSYVPGTIEEIIDCLGFMMLSSPSFQSPEGSLPETNIDTAFGALSSGLAAVRAQLGNETYEMLKSRSDRMRTYFEADPRDDTGDARKGREIILEMEDLLVSILKGRVHHTKE